MDIKRLIKLKIREIPNWPKSGVNFKDITPLLEDKNLFSRTINELCRPYSNKKIDKIVGIDARGFLLASAMAYKLKTGIAIVRKQGKLPSKTVAKAYSLEYASNTVEMHQDSILPNERILIVDDVLATGVTMKAAVDLVKQLKGKIVGVSFLIELDYLNGRKGLRGYLIKSLARYKNSPKIKKIEKLADIGIIGGSGLYSFFGPDAKEIDIQTQYGRPSDKITIGRIFGKKVAFLPRHGKNHHIPPHKINYRANIAALKELGVGRIIAPAAVGSLKREIKPGDFVICDQFIDRTKKRDDTFFDGPKVAHIEMARPYCQELRSVAILQAKKLKLRAHPKGTAIIIEGPKFSTTAESLVFSKMGCDVINMTQYPEIVLAQEMGMCYLNISLVTDYDVGVYSKKTTAPVSIERVLENFRKNTNKLKTLISAVIKNTPERHKCDCKRKAEKMLI